MVALIFGLALATLAYRAVMGAGLDQSAALFVGVPAIGAIAVALSRPAATVTGLLMKAATIGILLSGFVLGETLVCMVMASPLIYFVCAVVGAPIDTMRRHRQEGRPGRGPMVIVALVVLTSAEGAVPGVAWPADGAVVAVREIAATPTEEAGALAQAPHWEAPLPAFLRAGFPTPVAATGSGLAIGDRRRIRFVGDDHHGETHVGDLVLEVTERAPGRVLFEVVADDTRVAQWLQWQRAEVTWSAAGADRTRVSWRLEYERRLAPVWYFGPLQRYAAGLAAGYLIDTVATPRA